MSKETSVKLINTITLFNSIKSEWKAFEKSINHSNLTSSYDWLNAWWYTFKDVENNIIGYNKELVIICLYENNCLISVAPFIKVCRKKYGVKIRFLEFLGQQWAGNYIDILTEKPQFNQEIFDWLYKNQKFDVLMLKYIPQYSKNFNLENLHLYSACPEIEISEYLSHDDYVKNKYSKNLKQNIRTAFNKARKKGININTCVQEISTCNFNEMIRISKFKLVERKSWMYGDNNKLIFMKEVLKKMSSNVVFVQLDGKNVAYRSNVFFNNNKYCIDASYDRNYREFELGSISVDANLKDSYFKGVSKHCLGPGLDLYKKKFTKRNIRIYIFLKKGNTLLAQIIIKPIKILTLIKEKEAKQLLQ